MTFVNSPIAYGGFNTRHYTLVQGFCFFWLFLMGCKGLTNYHIGMASMCDGLHIQLVYNNFCHCLFLIIIGFPFARKLSLVALELDICELRVIELRITPSSQEDNHQLLFVTVKYGRTLKTLSHCFIASYSRDP